MKNLIKANITSLFFSKNKTNRNNVIYFQDPINELVWLKELKAQIDENKSYCEISIYQAFYHGQIVYYTTITYPRSYTFDITINLLNCNGQLIKACYFQNLDEFDKIVTNKKKLFSSVPVKANNTKVKSLV
jgi:hypothetical protein